MMEESGVGFKPGQAFSRAATKLNFICRTLRDEAESEDVAQNVFLQVYKSRQRYQPTAILLCRQKELSCVSSIVLSNARKKRSASFVA